ncbi:MAG: GLPGLI family protein [Bacteroidota bacterium]
MKNKLTILFVVVSLVTWSQTKGKITYKVSIDKSTIEEPYENPENTDAKNEALEMLHESQPVESYLVFNDSISLYYVEDNKEVPKFENIDGAISINPTGINFNRGMAGGDRLFYTDWSRNYNISTFEIWGEKKRVKVDSMDWTITNETKEIKGYLCKKAIKDSDEKRVAWFTEDLPVKHGPRGFNGLPGLILEFYNNKHYFVVKEIELNHPEVKDIIEPKEGPLITKEELRKLAGDPFGKD